MSLEKRRHPAQAMGFGELVAGEEYAFVVQEDDGEPPMDFFMEDEDIRAFRVVAVLTDTARATREQNRDDLNDNSLEKYAPRSGDKYEITVHMDGWLLDEDDTDEEPTITLWVNGCWKEDQSTIGFFITGNVCEGHTLIVPFGEWEADPRFHVLDWVNPDDVVKPLRAATMGSLAAAEKRRDAIFRRMFS